MPPPKLSLVTTSGSLQDVSTIPNTGINDGSESLPVVLARGVEPVQTFVTVPPFDGTLTTIVSVVVKNANRRYLKILNTGPVDVEIWTVNNPVLGSDNQTIKRGEILYANGGGLSELGERIAALYASSTSTTVASGLVVLEG